MPDRGRVAAALIRVAALLLPALLALRLPSVLDGQDAVHFAAGLEDFDPALERPHFPGYPLYIAGCRLAAAAGVPEAQALALPGVIASVALIPSMVAVGRAAGLAEAVLALAALLLAAQPLLWLEGPRAAPDLFGASLAWLALGLAARARSFAGGVALGLGLGVRVDLAPLAAGGVALESSARRRFLAGLAVGVLAWLPAFLLVLPPGALAGAMRFAQGHFLVWGSSALSGAGGGEAWRGLALALGGPLFAFASAWGAALAPARLRRGLGAALVPYALWVLLGQNLASPRHLLPLAPALALGAALAIAALRTPPRRALALGLVLASLWLTGRVARTPHPDGRELAARVGALCADCAAVFGGSEVFLLQRYGVAGPLLYQRASVAQVRRDLAAWPELEGPIGITSALADSAALPGQGSRVADGLRLYRLDASALRFAR